MTCLLAICRADDCLVLRRSQTSSCGLGSAGLHFAATALMLDLSVTMNPLNRFSVDRKSVQGIFCQPLISGRKLVSWKPHAVLCSHITELCHCVTPNLLKKFCINHMSFQGSLGQPWISGSDLGSWRRPTDFLHVPNWNANKKPGGFQNKRTAVMCIGLFSYLFEMRQLQLPNCQKLLPFCSRLILTGRCWWLVYVRAVSEYAIVLKRY